MKNFCLIGPNGKEFWISRAVTAVVGIFAKNCKGELYVLAVQRGKGTPDPEYIGAYCLPCGYLDYDETILEAAKREVKEETGLTIPDYMFKFRSFNDDPLADKRQNIVFKYIVWLNESVEELKSKLTSKYSEKEEVDSIKFIPLKEINNYKWAFNHDAVIKTLTKIL